MKWIRNLRNHWSFVFLSVWLISLWLTLCVVAVCGSTVFSQESPPAVPDSVAVAPIVPYDSSKSPVKLELKEVAERLSLTDKQRLEVSKLVAERAQLLSKEPDRSKWQPIYEENDKKLIAVLTADQLKNWPGVLVGRQIRPNIKDLSWEETLNWFTGLTGQQLVMDSPPPGTFSFSDSREYTPTELLDVINGVLQTRGYTLLKNGKMLMLFQLSRGPIPLQYVPQVKREELPDQGKFSYVTITIPMERRDRNIVEQQIQPFEGPYCRKVWLPGNTLMLTDTASTLQVLERIIVAVNNPSPPKPSEPSPPSAPPGPPAIWETYIIEKHDPAKIETIVTQFVGGKCLRLPGSNEIHFLVTPDQHGNIRTLIDRLENSGDGTGAPVVASYPLDGLTDRPGVSQMSVARMMAGNVGGDPSGRGGRGGGFWNSLVGGYQGGYQGNQGNMDVSGVLAASITALVKQVAGTEAIVSSAPLANKIIVFASPADQKKVSAIFETLRQEGERPAPPEFKIYQFATPERKVDVSTLQTMLQVVPTASLILDEQGTGIYAIATKQEHEQLAAAFKEIESKLLPFAERMFVIYQVTPLQLERFNNLFQQLIGRAKPGRPNPGDDTDSWDDVVRIRDTRANQLTIWAKPKQHEQIRKILQEISQPGSTQSGDGTGSETTYLSTGTGNSGVSGVSGEVGHVREPQLGVFPLRRGNSYILYSVLQNMISGGELTYDYSTNNIIAYGPPDMIAMVEKAVNDYDSNFDRDVTYIPLVRPLDDRVLNLLNNLVSRALIVHDTQNMRLMMYGRKTEVEQVEKIVKSYVATSSVGIESMRFHRFPEKLAARQPDVFLSFLKTEFPRANIQFDGQHSGLTAIATESQHSRIDQLIAEVEKSLPDEAEIEGKDDTVLLHSIKAVDFTLLQSLVQEIYPKISMTQDVTNARAIVRLPADMKEKVKSLIESIDQLDPDRTKRFYQSYALDGFRTYDAEGNYYSASRFLRDIQQLVPSARITFDNFTQKLIVWGTEEEHRILTEAVGNIRKDDSAKRFQQFPIRRADPYGILSMIYRMFPTTRPRYDEQRGMIVVEGGATALNQIEKMVAMLDPDEPGPSDPVVLFHQLGAEPTDTLVTALRQLAPSAQVISDKVSKQLMVIAKPYDQKRIAENVKNIVDTFTAPEEPMLFVYPVSDVQRKKLDSFLLVARSELTGLQILADNTPGQISIWAKPREHKLIADVLSQLRTSVDGDFALVLKTYPLAVADVTTSQSILTSLYPEAKQMPDTQRRRLLIWATDTDHDKIATTLKMVDTSDTTTGKLQLESFLLDSVRFDSRTARIGVVWSILGNLQPIVPSARLIPAADYRRIIVWGTPEEIDVVRSAVGKLGGLESPDNPAEAKAFRLTAVNPNVIAETVSSRFPDVFVHTVPTDKSTLFVFGQRSELAHVEKAIAEFEHGILQGAQMIQYSTGDTKTDLVVKAVRDIYPGLRLTDDPRNYRIFVWGTPDEHVRIGEMMKQFTTSADGSTGGGDTIAAHPLSRVNYYTAISMIRTMFPESQVFGDYGAEHLTVKATAKEQKQIADVLEQMQAKDSIKSSKLATYPIGDCNPGLIEMLLQSQLPEAESKSSQEVKESLLSGPNSSSSYQQYRMYGRRGMGSGVGASSAIPYFRVDAKEKIAIVFAPEEDQAAILSAIETLVAAAEFNIQHGESYIAKSYSLHNQRAAEVLPTLKQVAVASRVIPTGLPNDFLVYGPPSDQQKVADFVAELNSADSPTSRRTFNVLTLPTGTKYSRSRVIQMLTVMFPELTTPPAPGSELNQIVFWGPQSLKERMQAAIHETCKPLPEDQQTVPKTYTTHNISEYTAVNWLQTYFPNVTFSVDGRSNNVAGKSFLVVANPVEHAELEKLLAEIDKDVPDERKTLTRFYSSREIPYYTYRTILRDLVPNASVMPGTGDNDTIIRANPREHELIAEFFAGVNESGPSETKAGIHVLSIPAGTPFSRRVVMDSITNSFRRVYPSAGAAPNQIVVFCPNFQRDQIQKLIDDVCQPLPPGHELQYKTYHLKHIADSRAILWLSQLCPNAQITQDARNNLTAGTAIVVYGTSLDQLRVEAALSELDKDAPDDVRPVPKFYRIDMFPVTMQPTLVVSLRRAFPMVYFVSSTDRPAVMAVAEESVHSQITAFIEDFKNERDETAPYLETYQFTRLTAWNVLPMLRKLAPQANITPGATPDHMFVFATKTDHTEIDRAILKMETAAALPPPTGPNGESLAPSMKLYRIDAQESGLIVEFIQDRFPGTIAFAMDSDKVYVWANVTDHEKIAQWIGGVSEAFQEPYLDMYTTKHAPIGEALWMLQNMFASKAVIVLRRDTGDIAIQAIADVHEKIRKSIDNLDQPRDPDSELLPVTYNLSELPVYLLSIVRQNLQTAMPGVITMPSATQGQMIVLAKTADQTKVAKIIDEIVKKTPDSTPRMETYTFQYTTASAAMTVIAPIAPNARPGFGNDRRQLLIWATGADHLKIKDAVDRMNTPDSSGSIPRQYRFKRVSVDSVMQILEIQVPGITMTPDSYGDILLVTATPKEHEQVESIVAELDRIDPETQVTLISYGVGNIRAADVYTAISSLYRNDPVFRMYYSQGNKTFVALARPEQHQYIRDLIDQIQTGVGVDDKQELKLYNLKDYNYSAYYLIYQILWARGIDYSAAMQYDYSSDQVAVRVRPEIHQVIAETLVGMKKEHRFLDVYVLEVVDTETAQMAVRYLYYDEDYYSRPTLQVDRQTNTVFVRGSDKQILEIRDLLIRMGETSLRHLSKPKSMETGGSSSSSSSTPSHSGPSIGSGTSGGTSYTDPDTSSSSNSSPTYTGNTPYPAGRSTGGSSGSMLRVRQIDGDVEETVKQLQKTWAEQERARLIINRQDTPIIQEKEESPQTTPATPTTSTTSPSQKTPTATFHRTTLRTVTEETEDGETAGDINMETVSEPVVSTEPLVSPEPSPLYVTVNGDGTVTLTSFDVAALDRLEEMLQRINTRIVYEGRDYTIFAVRNINVNTVAQRLQLILRDRMASSAQQNSPRRGGYGGYDPYGYGGYGYGGYGGSTSRSGTLELTPDLTSNTLQVRGTKLERAEVAKLLPMLDVSSLPGEMAIRKPIYVPIESTTAIRIAQQVLSVYQQKMQMTQLPGGALPRITVDTVQNAVVIMAPEPLATEMKNYATELDKNALETPGRKLHLVQLEEVNAAVIQQALTIIRQTSQGGYSGYGSGYGGGYGSGGYGSGGYGSGGYGGGYRTGVMGR